MVDEQAQLKVCNFIQTPSWCTFGKTALLDDWRKEIFGLRKRTLTRCVKTQCINVCVFTFHLHVYLHSCVINGLKYIIYSPLCVYQELWL